MEFAAPEFAIWERLFFATRPAAGAIAMMTADEKKVFGALPREVTVYRGQQGAAHRIGFSWTLSREKAVLVC